jgi:hypothetical protein
MAKRPNEPFSKQEAERRFEAALRGAFKSPPTPMKAIAAKRSRPGRRARKMLNASSGRSGS